jgi:hypothetical protein
MTEPDSLFVLRHSTNLIKYDHNAACMLSPLAASRGLPSLRASPLLTRRAACSAPLLMTMVPTDHRMSIPLNFGLAVVGGLGANICLMRLNSMDKGWYWSSCMKYTCYCRGGAPRFGGGGVIVKASILQSAHGKYRHLFARFCFY